MPSVEGPTKYSAMQSIIYSLVLVPVGVLAVSCRHERHSEFLDIAG